MAHRCSAKEIRKLFLKEKIELLAPVSLTAPQLAPLQRPFEASLCFLSPFYYLRLNFTDKTYSSKIPLYVLSSSEMLVGFFCLNHTVKCTSPLLLTSSYQA